MTKWPCTPTIARLNRAEGFIDNLRTGTSVLLADGEKKARILLQAQADAEALGLAEWLRSFEEAALAEAARAYQEGKLQDAPEPSGESHSRPPASTWWECASINPFHFLERRAA